MSDCDPVTEQLKADRLEALYQASGRTSRDHPLCSRYTGLHQEELAKQQLIEQ
jgi:hypothetical protein